MKNIRGHDTIIEQFRRSFERGRLAGSFLFLGPSGVGKRRFAVALAKAVLCKGTPSAPLEPCETCESCRLFNAAPKTDAAFVSPHPDLIYVAKPPEKSSLPLELLIGDQKHRGETGLCYNISRTPFLGHGKVAILDDADFLKAEGANALLKTLEEPPNDSILILLGTSATKQLPTIRSRCKIIRFAPLSPRILGSLLYEQEAVSSLDQGLQLARRSNGGLDNAKELVDDALDALRGELNKQFSSKTLDSVGFAKRLNEFVESAGKEAPTKRRRLRLIFSLAVEHFHDKLRKADENAARRLERTLDALEQIDRNANLPLIVDTWCTEIK
jgi:DNA polymerase-3 subunit delta'